MKIIETVTISISRQTQKYMECLDKFEDFQDHLLNAMSDEYGDDKADEILQKNSNIHATKKYIGRLLVDSITTHQSMERAKKNV